MAFKSADFSGMMKFNSANSCDFLDMYQNALEEEIKQENSKESQRTIAPSSMYCLKKNWFRLRGVEHDKQSKSDTTLEFTALVGTACHEKMQSLLKEILKDDWIDIGKYVRDTLKKNWEVESHGFETRIAIDSPPIRFACDGLINFKGKLYLLEIKTSEYSSWEKLVSAKPMHVDQVKTYCAMLNVNNVLMVYQERQYGGIKVFEFHISDEVLKQTWDTFNYIVDMAEKNLPPAGLPKGDSRCAPSMCPYSKKCKQW